MERMGVAQSVRQGSITRMYAEDESVSIAKWPMSITVVTYMDVGNARHCRSNLVKRTII